MSISANYGPPADRAQGVAVIRKAHDKGVTFFDTAEVYGLYTAGPRHARKDSNPPPTGSYSRRAMAAVSVVVSCAGNL
jgi:aryl-alcohol dehydrogenase-like predicted oxidoreductase